MTKISLSFNIIAAMLIIFLCFKDKNPHIVKRIIVNNRKTVVKKVDLILTKETVYAELKKRNIKHTNIVYKQIMHETGWLKSRSCLVDNNLFGLYSSKKKRYMRFNHWTESIEAYKVMIQRRLKKKENYYHFLNRIKYAKDKKYIKKLKKIKCYQKERNYWRNSN